MILINQIETDKAKGLIPGKKARADTLLSMRRSAPRFRNGGNDLRQTYRTVAQATRVPELDVHLLMNHSIPGVSAGYITREKLLRDHFRVQQEEI